MPQHQTPGAYIEETRQRPPIAPASTGVTAFVGHTLSGPINQVVPVKSFLEFSNAFGGLAASSEVSYSVLQFFRNGGQKALIVRVPELETGLPSLGMIGGANSSFPMGLGCLETNDEFELLCIPDAVRPRTPNGSLSEFKTDQMVKLWRIAMDLCQRKRALLLIDAPVETVSVPAAREFAAALPRENGAFAAVFAPWPVIDNPLEDGERRNVPPGGSVAGILARLDRTAGVWKMPDGADAVLRNAKQLSKRFTNNEQDILNPLGINLLRDFDEREVVVWSGRTLDASDEWKYISVRRLANHIERSVTRGLDWISLEPNGEALWAQIRLAIGNFMEGLRVRGAFAGATAKSAYFVKCDRTTMTPADIVQGNTNVLIGFAPIKPDEFVILSLNFRTQPQNA